jgi:hypothetical protein
MKRVLLAALAGGLIVFIASAVAHIFTPLGTTGMSALTNEDRVLDTMRTSISGSGLYVFPGFDPSGKMTPEQIEKMKRGPTGLLVYTAQGSDGMSPRNLVLELVTNILAALIAAILISKMTGSVSSRAVAVALLAVFATVSVTASYWIWYGFPLPFILAELATEGIAWFLAGLAIAKIVPASR